MQYWQRTLPPWASQQSCLLLLPRQSWQRVSPASRWRRVIQPPTSLWPISSFLAPGIIRSPISQISSGLSRGLGRAGEKIKLLEILVQYSVFWELEDLYPTRQVDRQLGKICSPCSWSSFSSVTSSFVFTHMIWSITSNPSRFSQWYPTWIYPYSTQMNRKPLLMRLEMRGSFTSISRGRLQWIRSKCPNFPCKNSKDMAVKSTYRDMLGRLGFACLRKILFIWQSRSFIFFFFRDPSQFQYYSSSDKALSMENFFNASPLVFRRRLLFLFKWKDFQSQLLSESQSYYQLQYEGLPLTLSLFMPKFQSSSCSCQFWFSPAWLSS